jgi:hypothetical protein
MNAKTLFLSLALTFAAAGSTLAKAPHIGSWKLNEAQSHPPAQLQ